MKTSEKSILLLLSVLTLAAALLLSGCSVNDHVSTAETPAPATGSSDWERSTSTWATNTLLKLEVRVKPGYNYTLTQGEDHDCTFLTDDGRSIYVQIQGLDYAQYFDSLLAYFKSKNPEKLLVCPSSQAVIVVYDSTRTEICTKLRDDHCLTTIGPDVDTITSFFDSVMIRVAGNDYTPLDLSEDFIEN